MKKTYYSELLVVRDDLYSYKIVINLKGGYYEAIYFKV